MNTLSKKTTMNTLSKKTTRKPGLPLSRHQEIGAELYEIRNRLMRLSTEISNSHPKASKASRTSRKAADSIDSLRCVLDSIACSIPGGSPKVYYPGKAPQ